MGMYVTCNTNQHTINTKQTACLKDEVRTNDRTIHNQRNNCVDIDITTKVALAWGGEFVVEVHKSNASVLINIRNNNDPNAENMPGMLLDLDIYIYAHNDSNYNNHKHTNASSVHSTVCS